MTARTPRWNLNTLGPGGSMADDGFKYSDQDRRLIDRLLELLLEKHHHTGLAGEDLTPATPPNLFAHASGGAIPSGVEYNYVFTVVDAEGNESAASPAANVFTPTQVVAPNAPVLTWLAGTGSLQPGSYTYILSAYKASNSLETKALNSARVTVLGSNPSNQVTLTLPALPAGADGFNIYRKSPSGMHFLYIDSTTGSSYVDDGTVDGDCDRSLPPSNRSNNENRITISYPGATPVLPEGFSWRIYRTADASDWANSFLVELAPDPDATAVSFDDVGLATQNAGPPTATQLINSPDPIDLNDAAEVQGVLPPGRNVVPYVYSFRLPGLVSAGAKPEIWVCDFDEADILYCRAYVGTPPASTDIIVDVNAYRLSQPTPSWQSIYEDGPDRPRVVVSDQIGDPAVPVVHHLVLGDALVIDVDQTGDGATPTDSDLVVNIVMMVRSGSMTESYNFIY